MGEAWPEWAVPPRLPIRRSLLLHARPLCPVANGRGVRQILIVSADFRHIESGDAPWKFAIGFPRRTGCDIAGCGGPLRHTVPPQSQQRAKERSGGISEGDLRRRRRFRIHYRTERGCHVGCRWASFIDRCLHQVQKNALLPGWKNACSLTSLIIVEDVGSLSLPSEKHQG